METMVLGNSPNLSIDDNKSYMIMNGFYLTPSGKGLAILDKPELIELVGKSTQEAFKNNSLFTFLIKGELDETPLSELLFTCRSILNRLSFSFWLVKDNSIHIDTLIGINQKETSINKSPRTYFNAQGKYSTNHFNIDEIFTALYYFELINDNKGSSKEIVKVNSIDNFTTHYVQNVEYTNRLSRAMNFVRESRSTPFWLAKITFYISALEALLSNSNAGVAKQVSERTAKILEKDLVSRIKLHDLVYEAYDIRSAYIHGSGVTLKSINRKVRKLELDTIEEFLSELDEVLRRLIVLFLTDLNHINNMKEDEFAVWIKDLTLS